MVLFPLGLFFTYKAVNDSSVFNFDAYKNFIARITGRRKRELTLKEVVMDDVDTKAVFRQIQDFDNELAMLSSDLGKVRIVARIKGFFDKRPARLRPMMNSIIEHLSNTRSGQVITAINMYPFDIKTSNIDAVRHVNAQLFYLLKKEMGVNDAPMSQNDTNYESENQN